MCENQQKSFHSVTVPQRYLYVTLVVTQNDEFTMISVKMRFFQVVCWKNPPISPVETYFPSSSDLTLPIFSILAWDFLGLLSYDE